MLGRERLLALAAAGVLAGSGPVFGQDPAGVEITEWQVPWQNSRPRDPWVGGPGQVWFVGQRADYVATLDPRTGQFERFDLEPGAGPHTVIADGRGAWYAGNRARHIGLVDPETGVADKIMMPGSGRADPHTMAFTDGGDIWFTLQGGNRIGFLETATREVTLHDVTTPGARPYGLVVDEDDRPWATLFGTNRLATVEDGAAREIDLPRPEARPRRIALSGGAVWYVDYAGGFLGRYDPETGEFEEWPAPAGRDARPYAMASDDEGRLWFVETGRQPNRLVGFDPATERFTEPVEIESGGGTVRHMVFDAATSALWFGTDANTIGRARLE